MCLRLCSMEKFNGFIYPLNQASIFLTLLAIFFSILANFLSILSSISSNFSFIIFSSLNPNQTFSTSYRALDGLFCNFLLNLAPFFHAFQLRNSWTLSVIAFLAWFLAHWAITSIKFQSFFSFRIFVVIHCVFFCCRHCFCLVAKLFNQATKSWKYELLSIGGILTTHCQIGDFFSRL